MAAPEAGKLVIVAIGLDLNDDAGRLHIDGPLDVIEFLGIGTGPLPVRREGHVFIELSVAVWMMAREAPELLGIRLGVSEDEEAQILPVVQFEPHEDPAHRLLVFGRTPLMVVPEFSGQLRLHAVPRDGDVAVQSRIGVVILVGALDHALQSRPIDRKRRPLILQSDSHREIVVDIAQVVAAVLALPRDGRSLPFYSITVEKGDGSGAHDGLMIEAEHEAMEALGRMCGDAIEPVIIADRGFGNTRWLGDIQNRGWGFVQRIARDTHVETEQFVGMLYELGIRKGWRPRDWGKGTMTHKQFGEIRLVTVYEKDADSPWFLVTNIEERTPRSIVNLYRRRMWIEAMFRDLKNSNWGLGMDHVRLTNEGRFDRHFLILSLAYIFLFAFGAAAESVGLGDQLKANTVEERVLSLARIGNYFLQTAQLAIPIAIQALLELPT